MQTAILGLGARGFAAKAGRIACVGHARFYAPDLVEGANLVDLPEDESRHLSRVLRLGPGDEVVVFDGRGREYRARVERSSRGVVRVRVIETMTPTPEPIVALTLVQSVLKGDHMDDVIRDAVMMGVIAIQPIVTARTQVSLSALKRGAAVERWRRVAVASAKQCRRAVVPAIGGPIGFDEVLGRGPTDERLCLMLVEPSARPAVPHGADALRRLPHPARAEILVGPEGGWTDAEIDDAVTAGCVLLTLGRSTLRADAVPIVALSVLRFEWGDL